MSQGDAPNVVARLATLAAPATAEAQRGSGFYLNLASFLPVLLLWWIWIGLCSWIERDARRLHLPATSWQPLLWAGGVLGWLALWLVPFYWLGLALQAAFFFVPPACYLWLRNTRLPAARRLLTAAHVERVLARWFGSTASAKEEAEGPLLELQATGRGEEAHARLAQAARQPAYEALCDVLTQAVQQRASRLVLEPVRDAFVVQFRIDGVEHKVRSLSPASGQSFVRTLKLLAGLDLREHRRVQQGSFYGQYDGRKLEFRITTAGTLTGERVELVVGDRSQRPLGLGQLGLPDPLLVELQKVAQAERGLFLVCGPADSGRSTTGHALLSEIDRFQRNVVAIEASLRTPVPNVKLVRVAPGSGQTIVGELSQLMRQDKPDVLYVESVPDRETAQQLVSLACKDTLVLACSEAEGSLAALFHLVDLGLSGPHLAQALLGILSQRLLRILCPRCRVRYRPSKETLRRANLSPERVQYLYRPPEPHERPRDQYGRPVRCAHCFGLGYVGRTAVFEYLRMTEGLRQALKKSSARTVVRQEALRAGLRTLEDEALAQAVAGTTSIAEILRVLPGHSKELTR
ncbi:MAG: hypothetical protein C4297_06930 [Gemmataceae bacterium]